MGHYEWTGPRPFHDYMNDRVIESGETAEVDDDIAERFDAFHPVGEGDDSDESVESAGVDLEAVRDEHWQHVVSDVEDGHYDEHLDELETSDDRNSVQNAVEERRAALGE